MTRRLRRHADRLAIGTRALLRQFGRWLLPGAWRTAGARLVGSALGAGFALTVIERAPVLLWPASAAWAGTAWRTGRADERRRRAEAELVLLLDEMIGQRNGVILADVLAALHGEQLLTDWDVHQLRAACERVGVRVRDSLKVDGRVSVGVHREDLDAVLVPLPARSATPPPPGSSAGQAPTTSSTTPAVTDIGGGVAFTVHTSPRPPAAEPEPGPARGGFEDHLADALALLDEPRGEVTER
ncbi:MAG: hypothetical protein ACRDQ0_00825 [Pseudonocardia sp.]